MEHLWWLHKTEFFKIISNTTNSQVCNLNAREFPLKKEHMVEFNAKKSFL